jgi:hypothetical protein
MFFSRVFDRRDGKLLGYLADLTAEGALIICQQPLETDTFYRMSIDLPEDIFVKEHLIFEAKCIWCRQDVDPEFYMGGFQLLGLKAEDLGIIAQIVESYAVRD